MSHPLLTALGFGAVTFNRVEGLATDLIDSSPGSTAVFDDPSGIRVVLPATSGVSASTILVRSPATTPGVLSRKSNTVARVHLSSTSGRPVEFDAAVGDWSLFGQTASEKTELEIGAVAVKANIERLRAVDLRKQRRKGKTPVAATFKPLERKVVDGMSAYHLSGTVVSWALRTNRLTRGTWYQVLVDSVVRITVAVPVSAGKIAVGDQLVCDAVMCVSPRDQTASHHSDTTGPSAVVGPTEEPAMSAEDKMLLALGFAAGSRESLVKEARKASQETRGHRTGAGANVLYIQRYEEPSGAVLLVVEQQIGESRLVPLVHGNSPQRMETTAAQPRGTTVLDIYDGDDALTGIPADSDDYWSLPGSVSHLTTDGNIGPGALAVDIRIADTPGPVLRKVVVDHVSDGLTWISGRIVASEPQLNELTGLEWYKLTVDVGVPVTVAVPETVGTVPETGTRLWGNVRFCVQSGAWQGKGPARATGEPLPHATPAPALPAKAPVHGPEKDELEDIDDIDDSPSVVISVPDASGTGAEANPTIADELEAAPAETAPHPAMKPAPTAADIAEDADALVDRTPLPRGWLSYVEKSLDVDPGKLGDSPHVTLPRLSAPFVVAEVRKTPGDPYIHTTHIDRRFPLTASFCDCSDFTEHNTCDHLYPAFHRLHNVLGEEAPSAEELFDRLGDNPVEAFFSQYASDSHAMVLFTQAVQRNGGDSRQAVRTVITGIAAPESATALVLRRYVDDAVDQDLDLLPVLHKVTAHVTVTPDDGSRNDLFRVIDMILGRKPSRELQREAVQALPALFMMPAVPDDDRRSLAALVVSLFRRGNHTEPLPFQVAEDYLGQSGLHILRSLLGKWRGELSTGAGNNTEIDDRARFSTLSRLTAESFGTVHDRVTALLEADPPELATAVLLSESHSNHEKALHILQDLLKIQPENVTTTTPYQIPLHDALQILMKHGRKKGAAKVARRQFRENPCWASYLDLEKAIEKEGLASALQERDQVIVRLDDTEELTLDEVEVLVRLRLRALDFDRTLSTMEERGLYDREWAADTEELRGLIRVAVNNNLPDKVVDVAFRDAELAAGNDGAVGADGLKDAVEILYSARVVAERVEKSQEFAASLAAFRKAHRHNSLLMAFLDSRGLTRAR